VFGKSIVALRPRVWRLPLRPLLVAALVALAACHQAQPAPAGSPVIGIHPATPSQPAYVEVTGLSSTELSKLRDRRLAPADWRSLLKVTVGESADPSLPPVEGRYETNESAIRFTPLFPFDPGRAYFVTFDPGRLSHTSTVGAAPQVITSVVGLEAIRSAPTTRVTAMYPSIDVLPENALRLYLEFSAPMGNSGALDHVKLEDERGRTVDIPFLPVQADFWNADHTRYTLFFDPGRVKQGILPNEQLGRPLRAGGTYTLQVATDWPDAHGQPLVAPYRRTFRVGPAEVRPLSMATWRITSPPGKTRDPLVVRFPAPLDHGLLSRALGVEAGGGRPIEGDVALEANDTRWVFTPRAAWEAGEYRLVALAILEDPAGNRIDRAFEVDMTKASAGTAPEAYRMPFKVVESGF